MTRDGAELGLNAEQALSAVLGGEEPKLDDLTSKEGRRREILAVDDADTSYDGAAKKCAKVIIQYLERHPEDINAPIESDVNWSSDYKTKTILTYGWWDLIETKEPELYKILDEVGPTGFMWGWAANTVKWIYDKPTEPNPAILTIKLP